MATVEIGTDDYRHLCKAEIKYQIIKDALLSQAELDYTGNGLRICNAEDVIRLVEPDEYVAKVLALIARKKEGSTDD